MPTKRSTHNNTNGGTSSRRSCRRSTSSSTSSSASSSSPRTTPPACPTGARPRRPGKPPSPAGSRRRLLCRRRCRRLLCRRRSASRPWNSPSSTRRSRTASPSRTTCPSSSASTTSRRTAPSSPSSSTAARTTTSCSPNTASPPSTPGTSSAAASRPSSSTGTCESLLVSSYLAVSDRLDSTRLTCFFLSQAGHGRHQGGHDHSTVAGEPGLRPHPRHRGPPGERRQSHDLVLQPRHSQAHHPRQGHPPSPDLRGEERRSVSIAQEIRSLSRLLLLHLLLLSSDVFFVFLLQVVLSLQHATLLK
mmetsp:Transcript_1352/g.4611  ORF Transcript_1352/g.4611 Transcript_1352/m.4611 type:complete len:304 (+) Transcript_1352:212-1123(+)